MGFQRQLEEFQVCGVEEERRRLANKFFNSRLEILLVITKCDSYSFVIKNSPKLTNSIKFNIVQFKLILFEYFH